MIIFPLVAFGLRTVVYVLAALIPAAVLCRYIFKADKVEKEPPALLIVLLLGGALSTIPAGIIEYIFEAVAGGILDSSTNFFGIFTAICIVGVTEELCKYFVLKFITWKNRNFNYRFDGIVYAVFVSLGFAAAENIMYVFNYGLGVALSRAVLSIPGHMCFAVLMGYHYGRAKALANRGLEAGVKYQLRQGCIFAILAHGIYDACLMVDWGIATVIFFAYVIFLFIKIFRTVKKEAASDTMI